jgi:hypothetical protein
MVWGSTLLAKGGDRHSVPAPRGKNPGTVRMLPGASRTHGPRIRHDRRRFAGRPREGGRDSSSSSEGVPVAFSSPIARGPSVAWSSRRHARSSSPEVNGTFSPVRTLSMCPCNRPPRPAITRTTNVATQPTFRGDPRRCSRPIGSSLVSRSGAGYVTVTHRPRPVPVPRPPRAASGSRGRPPEATHPIDPERLLS